MTNPNDPISPNTDAVFIPRDMPKEWADKVAHLASGALGLTKREYFAAMAMQGLFANPNYTNNLFAVDAVRNADDLIVALNKEPKP